ncbi:MAG: hypothetical protein COA42_11245 [Alteromonadaceae bacterium]|nr:MAG: hypothetical protein COA42_11245 [Alteromonadaceae bacterium]
MNSATQHQSPQHKSLQLKSPQKIILIALTIGIIVLPFIGSLIRWGGLPPDFALLATTAADVPPFNLGVFIALSLVFLSICAFLLFPRHFGFTPPTEQAIEAIKNARKPAKLPIWLYIGSTLTLVFLVIMWGQFPALKQLTYYAFVPLWFGFILVLDGILHYRNSGKSLISSRPSLMIWSAFLSIFGWYYFEYLNFFVLRNWYYPDLYLISAPETYIVSALTFATIWPAVFVSYNLLLTFPKLSLRYSNGPKISLSPKAAAYTMLAGVIMCIATSVFYEALFWMLWLGPLLITCAALNRLSIWTPVSPITKGNWTPAIMIGLGTLCNSVPWESWNYWSSPNNPNFWKYNLPYIHEFLIFEMPVLGFSGYLFFGIECWVLFILFGKIIGINTDINLVNSQAHSIKGMH